MANELLKSCPFCGGAADMVAEIIGCLSCGYGLTSQPAIWNTRTPSPDTGASQDMREALARNMTLRMAMLDAANQCDKWAEESRSGGWSAHQVEANRKLAANLRKIATTAAALSGDKQ